MSAAQPGTIRALAFGDLVTGVWGLAGSSAVGAMATFADDVELDAGSADEESLLAAGGLELRFRPTSETAPFLPPTAGIDGHLQLCEVEGAVRVDGVEREVACFGIRSELRPPVTEIGSARLAAAWFGAGLGTAAVALRPARARGHESDLVACAFVDDGQTLEIDDPRLSTTYTDAGVPLRAGLELWPVEPIHDDAAEPDESDEQPQHEDEPSSYYPRRLAGESARDGSELVLPGTTLRAELFRWHTRGREGAGVYVIVPAP
ncbi:MAG TPA: hypothetical protein VMD48_14615 [Solirubrobacteraceae bacterium]|nr:hypothetical protein [Solirubrobacteraceae bacterium]